MGFTKLEPIKGGIIGCANCGFIPETLPMGALIAVGFGSSIVTKDGVVIYDENAIPKEKWDSASSYEEVFWTCQDAENEAIKDPDHDWRISLIGPLNERHYQRQGVGQWVLYKKGEGFA